MAIEGWRALCANGAVRESQIRGAGLADASVREVIVRLDSGAVRVKARPELGEQIRVFTRRQMAADMKGQPTGEPSDTVVVEITPDPERPDRFVRLYVGREVVLSTGD